ncbi:hypothetical protein [Pedosphaera parvula]|nr:hypothetical protein [Pedosphaera parvula]
MEDLILHQLYSQPGRQGVLVPSMFSPPIMLSNIFRIACALKSKGYTTQPDRRSGGWHLKLLDPGISACQSGVTTSGSPPTLKRL